MNNLKYTVIKDDRQYFLYCDILEKMTFSKEAKKLEDEIDLLTILIREYDKRDKLSAKSKRDPVTVLKSLMETNHNTQVDIAELLDVSKGYISEVLSYKKRLSSEGIRILADHFAIRQEALNQDYPLVKEGKTRGRAKVKYTTRPKEKMFQKLKPA
jgi:HTH-type transcriptional regulator/antitoxin HigA